MRNKISSIFGLLLVLAILLPSPVHAGRIIWSTIETPSGTDNVIVSPSEITALAIAPDSRTLYAVDTALNSKVYRSDDSGKSWFDLTSYLISAGATLPAWNLAIAPDNPQFIAVVTSTAGAPRCVFISTDGGQNWNNTNLNAAANISSIAVSPFYGNYDIAIGTRTGTGAGQIQIYKASGIGGTWVDQEFSGNVLSLKFSPSYRMDSSIAILYSTGAGTFFNVGVRDLNANTTNWTVTYSGNPPELTDSGSGTSPKFDQVITGDLELPADFSGQSPSLCRAYISIDAPGSNAGIFRVDGNTVFWLMTATTTKRISSISYFGTYVSGKLLAGEVTGDATRATVMTWYTDAPQTCPATCWYPAEKLCTGAGTSGYGNAVVIWSPDGSTAYAGTGSALLNAPAAWPAGYSNSVAGDESALSISKDNGQTWNQVSLIDTVINFLSDVSASPDTSTIYLASINTTGAGIDSIWRSTIDPTTKSWERVLCLPSASNDIILRMNNYASDTTIFMASRGTDDLRQSQDSGQTWKAQLPGLIVRDFSVTSINNVRYIYVLGPAYLRKGNVSAIIPQWSRQVATTLNGGHTVFASPSGVIVVGGDASDNRVAYSIDTGNTFSVTTPFPASSPIHVLNDYRVQQDIIIYATSSNPGSDIYAWAARYAPAWNPMGAPDNGFCGLAQMSTLYGAATSPATSLSRTLMPESMGPPAIEWNSLSTGLVPGVVFTREPSSLKLSSGNNLWAIDNRAYNYTAGIGRLWNFCDCLSPTYQYTPPTSSSLPDQPTKEELFSAPVLILPEDNFTVPIFIGDNSIAAITFAWQPGTYARAYQIQIAPDNNFSQPLIDKSIIPDNRRAPQWIMTDTAALKHGKPYFWRIRIIQSITGEKDSGEWSATRSFTIAINEEPVTSTPTPPSTVENHPVQTTDTKPIVIPTDNKTIQPNLFTFPSGVFWLWLITIVLAVIIGIMVIAGINSNRHKI